jgi:pyridoxine 5-phosphate synthase
MILLGVNIDHVATLRQARRGDVPDVTAAARAALAGGADGITIHLREDRRHIQDRDVADLMRLEGLRLNLEMAAVPEMVRLARVVSPHSVCLVPEKRRELTTEGGLDAAGQAVKLAGVCDKLKSKGIAVTFFVDPDEAQVRAAKAAGADAVELHTGLYADAPAPDRPAALERVLRAAGVARESGLRLHAGHGLDYENVGPVAALEGLKELHIGFAIVARAIFTGLEKAVREMKERIG